MSSTNSAVFTQEIVAELQDVELSQTILIPDLLPGARTKLEVILKNKTGFNLMLEEIRTSCGCVVVGNVGKSLPADGHLVLPIDLRTPTRVGKFGTSLTIIDSDKKEWELSFSSKIIAPLMVEQTNLNVKGTEIESHQLIITVPDGFHDIVDNLERLKVEANGEGIKEIQLTSSSENRGALSVKTQLPKERLIGGSFASAIQFSTVDFKLDVPIVFSFKDEPRVLLESVSRSRMSAGIQRVIIIGGAPDDRVELRVRAGEARFETELIKNGPKISIFTVGTTDDILAIEELEIGIVKNISYVPLSTVKVLD